MKISFVVPAYNEEAYIEACIRSIQKQAVPAFCEIEVIVVNNASIDRTEQVASKIPGVRVITEPRKGLTFARQAGFMASTGEIIANVDADTVLPEGWLSTVVLKFQNPKLMAISGPIVYFDLPLASNILIRFYYYFAYTIYLLNKFLFRSGSMVQGGNCAVRKIALEKIGGYNTTFVFYGEDTEMAQRLSTVGSVVFTFGLPMYSSGRRLKAEGFVTMGWKYPINYFWTSFFKKPFHTQFMDIRPAVVKTDRTSLQSLQQGLVRIGVSFSAFISVILLGGMYLSHTLSKLSVTTVAQAKESNYFVVREFGPDVLRAKATIYDIRTDSDDK